MERDSGEHAKAEKGEAMISAEDQYANFAIRAYHAASRCDQLSRFSDDLEFKRRIRSKRFAYLMAAGAYCAMSASHRTGYSVEKIIEIRERENPRWFELLRATV